MLDKLRRVRQSTSYNCGPAVVEMLLSHFGKEISQEAIIAAAGVEEKIAEHGMNVDELAVAVNKLIPEMAFWYKTDSRIGELREIVREYNYPVGINWQGIFVDDDTYEDAGSDDGDAGHYSVAIDVDTRENYIKIADPYGRFAGQDRVFSIVEFEKRWWDEDWEKDPVSRKKVYSYKARPMFVVIPETIGFPMGMGMRRL